MYTPGGYGCNIATSHEGHPERLRKTDTSKNKNVLSNVTSKTGVSNIVTNALTLEILANAKKLPVEYLQGLGLLPVAHTATACLAFSQLFRITNSVMVHFFSIARTTTGCFSTGYARLRPAAFLLVLPDMTSF